MSSGIKSSIIASYKSDLHLQVITWERIAAAAAADRECSDLAAVIQHGFPTSRNELPDTIRQFWPMRDDLYTIDGVPAKGNKILIPHQLHSEVLECLHSAHQGVNGMLANAHQRLFWPGLEAQLRQTRAQCWACNRIAPSQPKEPLADPPVPDFSFQQTVIDFCDISGHKYLIFADRYTGWVEATLMREPNARKVCDRLRAWYCTYGAPEEQASDGEPPFQGMEYTQFLENWGIRQRLSSAHYAQSNGRAESAVKTAKRILLDSTDASGRLDCDCTARAFMTHRNTPVQDVGLSPTVMLFGCPIKDHLPNLWRTMPTQPQWIEIRELREKAMAKHHLRAAEYYDHHTQSLPPLSIGDSVLIQNQSGNHPTRWEKSGRVIEVLPNRQYHVKVDGSNQITLHNHCFLWRISPVALPAQRCDTTGMQNQPLPYLPIDSPSIALTLPQELLSPAHSPNLTSPLEKDSPDMIQHRPEHEDATDAVGRHEEVPASDGRTPQEMPDVMPMSATSTPLMTQPTIPTSNTIPESPPLRRSRRNT